MLRNIILVGTGGAIGSVARYLIAVLMQHKDSGLFPWHTFIVNMAGCFLIGILFSFSNFRSYENIRLFLIIGIMGGFTTFSSFGLEAFQLLRTGNTGTAVLYMCLSQLAGVGLVYTGYSLSRQIV